MATAGMTISRRPSWAVSLTRLILLSLCLVTMVLASDDYGFNDSFDTGVDSTIESSDRITTTTTTSNPDPTPDTSPSSSHTRVVSIFYIDERAYEGLPYTLFHRDSGSVVSVVSEITTFVITTTRGDRRPSPTHSRTDNVTTGIPTLTSRPTQYKWTGEPSTITQGPGTFEFTGARFGGANHTVVNRCALNGTLSAACNLTHVGEIWYTGDPDWNGTYSTYSYNWTSGDRFGFAPVTITKGVEMLGSADAPVTAPASTNAAAAGFGGGFGRQPGRAYGGGGSGGWGTGWARAGLDYGLGAVFPAVVLALAVAL